MIADNIDNLETNISGSGTSHRVNLILVMKGKQTKADDVANEAQEAPAKIKYRRSLPTDLVGEKFLITLEGSAWDQKN